MKKNLLFTIQFITILLFFISSSKAQVISNATNTLDINNVSAGFLVHGDMFWNPTLGNSTYEFPKGSGKFSSHATALWIGAYDNGNSQLVTATQKYRNNFDFFPGPAFISLNQPIDSISCLEWAKIWKVNKTTIDSFLSINTHTLANTHPSILDWPAKGNQHSLSSLNNPMFVPDRELAPFVDVNSDGVYNPLDGDYPKIKGEQMLWWVFNDKAFAKTNTNSPTMNLEIHASAYACKKVGIENTIFVNYKINYWGSQIYDSAVVGLFVDGDLGNSFDDFIGFDSSKRMGIFYNSDILDEGVNGYGTNLTQHGTVLIKSPNDTASNLKPMGSFIFFDNSNNPVTGKPQIGQEFFNYLNATWKDGSSIKNSCIPYGLNGNITKYVFPNDPSNVSGISEKACGNLGGDRRFVMSCMPIKLLPGMYPIEYTFAFINTDTGSNNANFNEIKRLADSAYKYPDACETNFAPTSVNDYSLATEVKVFPTVSNQQIIITDLKNDKKQVIIFNAIGEKIYEETFSDIKKILDINSFSNGVYFLEIIKDKRSRVEKIIKY
ncbi:MAG: T9SS type A sorting domain-containing protein [Chitinophagaceae bacterium]|nr:T9SS type A sorting domain-containing protein [Chitinophagaceae bacterium]